MHILYIHLDQHGHLDLLNDHEQPRQFNVSELLAAEVQIDQTLACPASPPVVALLTKTWLWNAPGNGGQLK